MERLTHWNEGLGRYTTGTEKGAHSRIAQLLAAYENTGITPDQIRKMDELYREKCEEVNRLKDELAAERQKYEWIPVDEELPKADMKVQAIIKHHKWIADYDSDWVPEEEKTVHPEWTEICEAIYKNGEFTFRCIEDDCFAETAYVSPENNITKPVSEILKWRPIACAEYDGWIPVEYPPKTNTYILLSFSNFSLPMVGRYGEDENGWAFYLGDCDGKDTCTNNNLYVNAWQPLPEPYRPEKGEQQDE